MDLKSFREDKLKLKTQAAFAELLGVDQSSVSRWEKDESTISWSTIENIARKTGASLEEITGWKKPIPKALEIKDAWEATSATKKTLLDYVSDSLGQMEIAEEYRDVYVSELQIGLDCNLIKPKIAIVGRSDTGKSTLINALLGAEKMPTSWTPTTSVAVYIKHISEKPNFIEEDAWVFASQVGSETMWDESRLNDEEYCRTWKIAAGGVEILKSYGTRQGDNYEKEAGAVVLFIDSPILRNCDIIDLPGFGTETESDDNITYATSQKADAIIYLSQANGFMRIEDITYLKRNISELPSWEKKDENKLAPLSNLFIVASQAHAVNNGNREQLKEILDAGCSNLLKTLPESYWDNRAENSGYEYSDGCRNELRSRFFAYTTDIPEICEPFNNELRNFLETLPSVLENEATKFVRNFVKTRRPALERELGKYKDILSDRQKYVNLLEKIEDNELNRAYKNDAKKNEVRQDILSLKADSLQSFSDYYASVINEDTLVNLLKERGTKNKKNDVELFGSYLQSKIQKDCEAILVKNSDDLCKRTSDYITFYNNSISNPFTDNGFEVDFDAGWAFASALSKLTMIGGLGGFLYSTIYSVLFFTGLGFSVGSSILWGLSAASLGPIGIGVGLMIAGAMGVVKLFGGGWQKSVAKKIVKAFEENKIQDQYRKAIGEYWDQTEDAFNQSAQDLEQKWNDYVQELRETVNTFDVDDIQRRIASLQAVVSFFDNMPM